MSVRTVGYEGEGRHRRPIRVDEGPASAAVDGLAALGRLSVLDVAGVAGGGAGPVERRQATAAELAARATDRRPALNSPEHLAQSRRNGAARTSAIHAARRAQHEEETVMPLPEMPEPPDDLVDLPPLERLAAQAKITAAVHQAKVAADEAWVIARTALREAYAAVALDVGDLHEFSKRFEAAPDHGGVPIATTSSGQGVLLVEAPAAGLVTATPAPSRPSRAQEAQEKVERARRVMAAMERHGGDQRAVAAELGMRPNAVAMVVKHARARAETTS